MKQVIQSYKTGELQLAAVPAPQLQRDTLLMCTVASLISVGTERYMLDMARKSLVGKALARPDLVRQVVAKAQAEGPLEAWRQAMCRLDTPVPLGYSAAGVVIAVGEGVAGFAVGDRVACAGSGIASHAEVLRVPRTLAVKIPDNVGFEAAAFVALGSIAMHAVRTANLTFGERVVVLGVGLLGQLAVQILNAAGCYVIGMDPDLERCRLAEKHGARATWMAGIFYFSSRPEPLGFLPSPTQRRPVGKVAHFAEYAPWLKEEIYETVKEKAVPRDEYRDVLSRLDGLEKDVSVIKELLFQTRTEFREDQVQMRAEFREDLGELRREMHERFDRMNERFDRMNGRFDQMSERMLVQTRWLIGSIALFGTILTIMMAIAQFTP